MYLDLGSYLGLVCVWLAARSPRLMKMPPPQQTRRALALRLWHLRLERLVAAKLRPALLLRQARPPLQAPIDVKSLASGIRCKADAVSKCRQEFSVQAELQGCSMTKGSSQIWEEPFVYGYAVPSYCTPAWFYVRCSMETGIFDIMFTALLSTHLQTKPDSARFGTAHRRGPQPLPAFSARCR